MSATWTVSRPMSWSEIREQFPDQWLALVSLDWVDDHDQPLRFAFIAGHGTRREALRQAKPLLKLFDAIGQFHTSEEPPEQLPIVYVS